MSSLPQSWHGIGQPPSKPVNTVSPLKRPKTLQISPINGPTTVAQPERQTWNQRPTFDPSTIDCASTSDQTSNLQSATVPKTISQNTSRNPRNTQRPMKPTMPVSTYTGNKFRAKSLGNGQELKSRMQEEINMEISSLRKELSHAREEITSLKGKLRRAEDESAKKIKQMEKQLSFSKKDYLAAEKKKDVSEELVINLKKKCQQLEVEMRTKDTALRKMQTSLRSPPRPGDRSALTTKKPTVSSALLNSGSSNARPLPAARQNSSKTNSPSPETTRLRDSNKRLLQDVTKLQQQLKDKEQEIRTMRVNMSRNQRTTAPTTSTRLSSAHLNKDNSSPSNSTPKNPQRVSRSTLHRIATKTVTTTTKTSDAKGSKHIMSTYVVGSNNLNGIPVKHVTKETKVLQNIDKNSKVQELQRKAAARKIQRGWRSHRERAMATKGKATEEQVLMVNQANEILISEEAKELLEEDIEYLQSVLKGHLTRTENSAAFQNIDLSDDMTTTIEEIHQNCLDEKDGKLQAKE